MTFFYSYVRAFCLPLLKFNDLKL